MGLIYSPKIVTNGLILALDAVDKNSYPGSGTTWYNAVSTPNATLPSSSTYSNGAMVHTNNSTSIGALSAAGNYDNTMEIWTV
jgi:hypothetical protein